MQSEKRKERTKQIVIRIKEVIKDMSDAEVMRRMTAAGEQTSTATIRRIKAEGSENTGFNYELTIRPYARVFLGLGDEPIDLASLDSEEEKDRATLQNIIQTKNDEIARLSDELARERDKHRRDIDYLIGQDKNKNKLLDERADFLRQKDAEIASLKKICHRLFSVLCLGVIALIFALMSDSILRLF